MRTVIVTGVMEKLGRNVARALLGVEGLHVLGVAGDLTGGRVPGVEYVEADLRNPLLSELLAGREVDTIAHAAFRPRRHRSEPAFEHNVADTMRLFGAAAEAGVRKIVFPSSTLVYGAVPDHPAFIRETAEFRGDPRDAFVRELREIESFVNGFRQTSDVAITVLRFAHPLGPRATSPLARWLALPAPPAPLGFDPRMQVIHTDDVVAALVHAVQVDAVGTYNVAADEVLTLYQLITRVGKIPAVTLHPVLDWGVGAAQALHPALSSLFPLAPAYLRYACVGATDRMRDEFGFTPQYTAREAASAFAESRRTRRYAGLEDAAGVLQSRLQAVMDLRQHLPGRPSTDDEE